MFAFCQAECFPLLKSSHRHSSALSSHFSSVLASILVNLTLPARKAVRSIMHKWSSKSYLLTVHFLLTCCLPPKGFGWLTKKDISVSLCAVHLSQFTLSSLGKRKMPMQTSFSAFLVVSMVLESRKLSCINVGQMLIWSAAEKKTVMVWVWD